MGILKHLLNEYDDHPLDRHAQARHYDDYQDDDDYQQAQPSEMTGEKPPQNKPEMKVHKIKQTFAVDQGDCKLDTTVLIKVAAKDESDAKRIADQQLAKLAAYMKDIDLNDSDEEVQRSRPRPSIEDFHIENEQETIQDRALRYWNK